MSMEFVGRLENLLARAGSADATNRALLAQKNPREYLDLSRSYDQSAGISRFRAAASLVGTVAIGGGFTLLSQWFGAGTLKELSSTLAKSGESMTNAGLGIFVDPKSTLTNGNIQILQYKISSRQSQGQSSSTEAVSTLRQLVAETGQLAQRAFSSLGG